MTPRTQYARNGDVYLAYQVVGEGPRDLVLSLDWASHLEVIWEHPTFGELVSSLVRLGRVLCFDMRGIGLSDNVVGRGVAPEDWSTTSSWSWWTAAGSERATLLRRATLSKWR